MTHFPINSHQCMIKVPQWLVAPALLHSVFTMRNNHNCSINLVVLKWLAVSYGNAMKGQRVSFLNSNDSLWVYWGAVIGPSPAVKQRQWLTHVTLGVWPFPGCSGKGIIITLPTAVLPAWPSPPPRLSGDHPLTPPAIWPQCEYDKVTPPLSHLANPRASICGGSERASAGPQCPD